MAEPALGLVELTSIPRGVVAADAMAKKAPVRIVESHSVCPGKYIVLIAGEVEPVEQSLAVGVYYAGASLVDRLFLPQAHPDILPAVAGTTDLKEIGAIGILETFSVASTILAADACAKAAEVKLMELRLANGLGGKGFLTLTGELCSVEAAIAAGVRAIESGLLATVEIIPAPHEDIKAKLLW